MNKQLKTQHGFTLIELLVVIAIIGILTTLITSNLAQSQARARDARRKSDLRVIAQGLEMYYSQNNQYPDVWTTGSTAGKFTFTSTNLTDPTTTDIYIKSMPKDPKNSSGYEYYYCTNASGNARKSYNLYAKLENLNDPEKYCNVAASPLPTGFSDSNVLCDATDTTNCSAGSNGTAASNLSTVQSRSNYTVSDP